MEFLISITIKSTFILLFSGVLLWALKNATATLRHWVISLTMIGLLGLPLLVGMLPDFSVPIPYLPIKAESVEPIAATIMEIPQEITNNNVEFPNNRPFVPKEKMDNYQVIVDETIDNQKVISSETSMSIQKTKAISLEEILLTIWLVGGLFFLLKLIIGRVLIRNITINSEPFFLAEDLRDYVSNITKKEVRFLTSHAIKTPMTWRGFKPVVLLPIAAKSWSVMELKTVLLHELNHIKRNDYWLHTLGLIAVCLYWYHPLIWVMKKRQLLEREKACDEAVLRAGIPQQNYAEQLVHIARQLSGRPAMISEAALPMAKISQTKARILAILQFDQQKFDFSKWKQWNWGLFYAFLFPVLAAFSPVGTIIQEHFDLPKLDSISPELTINQTNLREIPTDLLVKEIEEVIGDIELSEEEEMITEQEATVERIDLDRLEKKEMFLPIASSKTQINIPQKRQKTGLFGKWKEGKIEFKIWTYGDFKLIPEAPFIEVTTPDGIVFIEEYIPGLFSDKVNQLTIAKAATNVRKRGTYKKAMDMRPSALITKGTPIKIWSENSNYDKWMATKGQQIAQHLMKKKQAYLVKEVADENSAWWSRVEGAKEWIDFYFVTESKIAAKIERRRKRSMLKSDAIPYQKLPYLNEKGKTQIIGPTTLSGKDVGNKLLRKSLNPKGTEYMTVLTGTDKPALVKEFNFHLSKNDFKNLVFELRLYNVVDGAIKYAITQSPIPITVKKGSGWIKKDLSSYGIISQGDILVVLENIDFSGAKNGKGLYFSLADNHEAYQHLISANFEWKTKRILERAFVMNVEVEENMDRVGVIKKEVNKGYLLNWQKGKSEYKVWTYGDFKTYNTIPYIEVVDPNGMVIIEEIRKTAFGTKKYKLAVTKAPHEGILVQTFKYGQANSWSGKYKENEPLHLWYENEEWVFLGSGKNQWIDDKLSTIFWELDKLTTEDSDYQPVTQMDQEWWSVIQQQQAIKAKRFIMPPPTLKEKTELEAISLVDIPYKAIQSNKSNGLLKKIGRTKATKTMSGFSGESAMGYKFGTLLKASTQPSTLKDLNFNIRKHKFQSLTFDCHFFKIVDNEIQHALTEKPIRIKIGAEKGWIKRNLAEHQIGIDGDVLVVMEVVDYSAEAVSLFFALAPSHIVYKPEDKLYKGEKLEFWDSAFALYLTVD